MSYTSETCATTCEENGHNFETGKTYDYDLLTKITTSIPGTTEQQSSLQLTALAHIDVLSPCELALRVCSLLLMILKGHLVMNLGQILNWVKPTHYDGRSPIKSG